MIYFCLFSLILIVRQHSLHLQYYYKSSSRTSTHFATDVSTPDLSDLSLVELKELSKTLGGKTSNMRKSQIIDVCLQLMKVSKERGAVTNFSTATTVIPPFSDSTSAIIPAVISTPSSSSPSSSSSSSSSSTSPSGKTYVRRLQPVQSNTIISNNNDIIPSFDSSSSDNNTISNNDIHNSNNSANTYNHTKSYTSQQQQQQSNKRAFSIDQRFPTGMNRMDRFEMYNTSDMEITFLGTASCVPSVSRGVSSIAFRCRTKLWLFDCGESTQIQLQQSTLRPSKISKIFLTHLHGDHSFGIPGVLCMLGQSTQDERGKAYQAGDVLEPLDIYGPEGTRDYIRAVTALTYSRIAIPHRIHELKNIPFLHSRYIPYKQRPNIAESNIKTSYVPTFGEREGGTDIYPDEKTGIYNIFEDDELTVHAAPMQHSVPCVGFVVTEKDRVGRLNVELAQAHVESNKVELGKIMPDYRKTYTFLKNLKPGASYGFPDGTQLTAEQVLEPSRVGRKVAILGDTCNADRIAPVCQNADVVVHEATNAWDTQSAGKFSDYRQFEQDTFSHGHSTPQIAGRFARLVNADKLILTHFSPRYRGDESEYSMRTMWQLEDMARIGSGYLFKPNDVIAAWDQLVLPIIPKDVYVNNNDNSNNNNSNNNNSSSNNSNNSNSNNSISNNNSNNNNNNNDNNSTTTN